jgi:hypothetical protein
VSVALLPPPVAAPKPLPPKPRPKPKRKAKPKPPPPVAPSPPAPVIEPPALQQPAETAPEPSPAGMEAPGTSTENAVDIPLAEEPVAVEEEPAGTRYKLEPPPSAELQYDVQALRDEQNWYGSGVFRWESAGGSYRITGEASVRILFKITVLNFSSEGRINDYGIAPVLYSEKPWRKSMTNTHFQQDKGTISFSASTATYPYNGGEQDRASIMWQLASIGRGDAGQFAAGSGFDIVVAGARDAETWHIDVIGQEEVDTPYGRFAAWHVRRAPRAGSYDQKIDIWLAPQQEWYPVKLLYTYANGDHLEMSLSGLAQASQH